MAMGVVAWKVMGTGGAILAGFLAKQPVDAVWARFGQDDINPKSPRAPLAKAVAYAAVTGLAVGAARTVMTRKAAEFYEKSAGPSRRTSARTPSDPSPPPPVNRSPQGRSRARASGIPGR